MGIPGFFRWLKKKYPNCVQKVDEDDIEDVVFDNLYIDMNGIIHPCFHPEGMRGPRTYDEVFQALFKYLDRIFAVVRPRKLLFMAVDGVAPRAKMNHQRSRRFRAAKEALKTKRITAFKSRTGKSLLLEQNVKMDSNVITPGTEFMELLSSALRYYIHLRMNDDLRWQGIKVVLSDSSVPGEGEHKIMSYIRLQRNLPGFDPNTRHCLYGLDADLIMLSLTTHEIHFTILRECGCAKSKVGNNLNKSFRGQKRKRNSKKKQLVQRNMGDYFKKLRFQFVKTWVLREYLSMDMMISNPGVNTDMERLIDDFVFICLFVGNDFLPNLPTFEVSKGALNLLLKIYRDEFVERGGYLTDSFEVNLKCLEHFLQSVGTHEHKVFDQRKGTSASRKHKRNKPELGRKQEFYAKQFKAVTQDDCERIQRQSVSKYIEGVCWVMHYYYEGVCSWQWFYPYHYAPFASDFCGIDQLEVQFTLGKPFKPLDQLMAVLPAASAHALPLSYRELMTNVASPILDFYPDDFEVDMEGKLFPWQATCILPFIEESRLLEEIAKVEHKLTDGERQRNTFGMDILFIHRSHPLAGKINSICQQISSQPELQKGEIELEIDPKLSDGMNGSVRISDKILWPVEIISPIKNMKTISKNEVISVCYKYPVSHSHIPRPPEGVVVPETSITKEDHSHLNVLYSEKNPCISQLPRPDSAPFPSPYHIAEVNQSQANGNHSAVVGLGERKTEKKSRKRKRHRRMGKNLGSNSELDNNFEMLKSSFPGEQNNGNAYNADLDGLKDVTTEVVFGEKDLRSEIMKLCEGNKIQSVNVETSVNPSENDVKHQNILIISEQSKADDLFGGSNGALEVKTEVKSTRKRRSKKRKSGGSDGISSSNIGKLEGLNNNVEKLESCLSRERNDRACSDGFRDITAEVLYGEKNYQSNIVSVNENNKIQDTDVEKLVKQNGVKHQSVLVVGYQSKADGSFGGSDGTVEIKTEVESGKKKRRPRKKKTRKGDAASNSSIGRLEDHNENCFKHPSIPDISVTADLFTCIVSEKYQADGFAGGSDGAVGVTTETETGKQSENGVKQDVTTGVVSWEENLQPKEIKLKEDNEIQGIRVQKLVKHTGNGLKCQNVLVSEQTTANGFCGRSDGGLEIKSEVESGKARRYMEKKSRDIDAFSNSSSEALEKQNKNEVEQQGVPDRCASVDELMTCIIISEQSKVVDSCGDADGALEIERDRKRSKEDKSVEGDGDGISNSSNGKSEEQSESIKHQSAPGVTVGKLMTYVIHERSKADVICVGPDGAMGMKTEVKSRKKRSRSKKKKSCETEGDGISNSSLDNLVKQNEMDEKYQSAPSVSVGFDKLMTSVITELDKADGVHGASVGVVEINTEVGSGTTRSSKKEKSDEGDSISDRNGGKMQEPSENGLRYQNVLGVSDSVDESIATVISEQSKAYAFCGGPDKVEVLKTETKSGKKRERRKKKKSDEGGVANSSGAVHEKYQSAPSISVSFDKLMTSVITEQDKADVVRGASVGVVEINTEVGSGTMRSSKKEKSDEGDSVSDRNIGKMQEPSENGLRYQNVLGFSDSVDKSVAAVINEQSKAHAFCGGPDKVEVVKTETKSGKKRKRRKKKKSGEGGVANSSGAVHEKYQSAPSIDVGFDKLMTSVITEQDKADVVRGASVGVVEINTEVGSGTMRNSKKEKSDEGDSVSDRNIGKMQEPSENSLRYQNVLGFSDSVDKSVAAVINEQSKAHAFCGGPDKVEVVKTETKSGKKRKRRKKKKSGEGGVANSSGAVHEKYQNAPSISVSFDKLMTSVITEQDKADVVRGASVGVVEINTEVGSGTTRSSKKEKSDEGDSVSDRNIGKMQEPSENGLRYQNVLGFSDSVDKSVAAVINEQSKAHAFCGGPDKVEVVKSETKSGKKRKRTKKKKSGEGGVANSSGAMDEKYQTAPSIDFGFDKLMTSVTTELDKADGVHGASVGVVEISTEVGSGTTRSSKKEKSDEGDSISDRNIGKMQEPSENGLRYQNVLGVSDSVDESTAAVISEQSKASAFCGGPDKVEVVKTETKSGKKEKANEEKEI